MLSPRPGEAAQNPEGARKSRQVARAVSPEVRERVLERAGHRCEYRGPDGSRCTSRTGLQIEHTRPFAVYRSHDERFLKAFCPAHNLFAAERFYGREFIRRKIAAGRRERSGRQQSLVSAAKAPAEGGYEPTAYPAFLGPGPHAPEAESVVVETAVKLGRSPAGKKP